MEHLPLIAVLLLFLGFALVSRRIDGSMITPPMLFTGAGLVLGPLFFGVQPFEIHSPEVRLLLEITLVLVLFSDAAAIDLKALRQTFSIPARMLVLGIPLTIILGTGIAYALPLGLTFCETALVIAILAPTDAALGQVVITSKQVPVRIRQALSVESGLNDGLALPVVLLFASIASALATDQDMRWLQFGAMQLILGPLAGIAVGYLGARLLDYADQRNWVSDTGLGIIALVLAGISYVLAETVHGNGFIAAFVAGLVFGNQLRNSCNYLFEFVETEGQILTQGAFFVFGALFLPHALVTADPVHWLLAILSLTLLRMAPVAISLSGLGLDWNTRLFLGWFGPRGLASILFISLVIGETALPNPNAVVTIIFITVFLSIFLHGVSAAPLAAAYGRRAA